jgi:hypothetical protein
MDYIAIPWITDYLEELRVIIRDCDKPLMKPEDTECIRCRELVMVIARIEEILKEHGI